MSSSPVPLHPALILVVDDQPRNVQLLKALLAKEGFQVISAESGKDALQMVEQHNPDCILLDVMMPEMDGFDVCTRIKAEEGTRDIPIIFLTGETQLQSIKKGFEAGGVDYITKPFNKHELVARVTTHVELRRAQKRHTESLLERTRIINIIAQHWHKPLQRLVLLTSQTRAFCRTKAAVEDDVNTAAAEAERTASQMLASLEDFLLESETGGSGRALPSGQITSDDLKAIVSRWYVTAIRRQIEFHLHAPKEVILVAASSFAATQVIDQVLSNAVNATPSHGSIAAQVFSIDGKVVLEVENDGTGFPAEYLKKPFVPCVRKDSAGSQTRLGLGLALAKRAADVVSAKIELSNRTPGGARVRILFPAAKPPRKD